ncbi:hypothetical protein H7169_00875 [Candidatus Gracilibacteria bacterium]|nr:hypothetical protein [Candidatus Gracilibacteria bacterium]
MSHRPALPPHLGLDEEPVFSEDIVSLSKSRIGPQGKSKYGKGGARLYKAKGRAGRA